MSEDSETFKLVKLMLAQDQSAGARAEQGVSELRGQLLQIQKQLASQKKEEKELDFSQVVISGLDSILKDKNSRLALIAGVTFFSSSLVMGLLWIIDRHPGILEQVSKILGF